MPHDAKLPCSDCGELRLVCWSQIRRVRDGGKPLICSRCRGRRRVEQPKSDPVKPCRHCGEAFVRWPVRYCEACRPIAEAKRRSRSGAHKLPYRERGYGSEHVKERRKRLAMFMPGDPCARCSGPMYDVALIDLDHTDDRTGYLGLSHSSCNRSHRPGAVAHDHHESVCDTCGVPYRTRWPEQRYCSNPCRYEASRQRGREGRREREAQEPLGRHGADASTAEEAA